MGIFLSIIYNKLITISNDVQEVLLQISFFSNVCSILMLIFVL